MQINTDWRRLAIPDRAAPCLFGRAVMARIAVAVEVTKTLATPPFSGRRADIWPLPSPRRRTNTPHLLVLDPLVRLHGVDENAVADIAPTLLE